MSPEQKERLMDRMNEPDKNWKFNIGDVHERQLWPKYMSAYQDTIEQTTSEKTPWFVIPPDDKPNMRACVNLLVVNELKKYPVHFPEASEDLASDFTEALKMLNNGL